MKKRTLVIIGLIILILSLLIISANNRLHLKKESKVMKEFETMMAKDELTVSEAIKYLEEKINTVSKENASSLVLGLERVHQNNLWKWQKRYEDNALQEKLAGVYQSGWTREKLSNIADEELKQVLPETVNNGFKVETAEGFYFPVIDYTFYQKYQSAVTPDLVAYLEIMAVESERAPVKDAALIIEWEEILKRAERQEQFIKEYGFSSQVEPMRQLLKRYVTFALFGCDNTPLFSYDTKQMKPEVKQAYEEYVRHEVNGDLFSLINEYLDVLEENDFRLTGEVDDYRKNVVAVW